MMENNSFWELTKLIIGTTLTALSTPIKTTLPARHVLLVTRVLTSNFMKELQPVFIRTAGVMQLLILTLTAQPEKVLILKGSQTKRLLTTSTAGSTSLVPRPISTPPVKLVQNLYVTKTVAIMISFTLHLIQTVQICKEWDFRFKTRMMTIGLNASGSAVKPLLSVKLVLSLQMWELYLRWR